MKLDEIFGARTRVNVFANKRNDSPSCIAMIAEGPRPADGMTLVFDEGDLIYAELKPGDRVQIGFGHAEAGMYFTSDVTVREVAASRVHVSTPGMPYKWPRRAHGRAPADWPCTLTAGTAAPASGTTINVAASGVLLTVEETPALAELAVGASVALVLLPPDRPPLECTARIVRVSGHGKELGRLIVALRFLDLPEADEMKLQLLVLRATARRYLRCRVAVPCQFHIEDGSLAHACVEGVTENLSGNGVLLIVPSPPPGLERGQLGALSICLSSETVVVKVVEVIRTEVRADNSLAMALKYVQIDRDQRHAIVEFVFERVRDV